MPKNLIDVRKEIRQAKVDIGLLQEIPCTKEDNKKYRDMVKRGEPLPQGIFQYEASDGFELNEFCSVYDPQLTEKEQQEYIALMQYKEIKTIRNCVVFFTVLTVISLILLFFVGIRIADIFS